MKSNNEHMTALAVIAKIRAHTMQNPVTSREIEQTFGISGVKVRDIVHDARVAGHAIGSNTSGYFECRNFAEWEQTRDHLHSRAMSILSILRKVDETFNGQQQSIFQ